jgi:hypothetical protein
MVSDDVDPVLTVELKRDVASAWLKRGISEALWLLSIVSPCAQLFPFDSCDQSLSGGWDGERGINNNAEKRSDSKRRKSETAKSGLHLK